MGVVRTYACDWRCLLLQPVLVNCVIQARKRRITGKRLGHCAGLRKCVCLSLVRFALALALALARLAVCEFVQSVSECSIFEGQPWSGATSGPVGVEPTSLGADRAGAAEKVWTAPAWERSHAERTASEGPKQTTWRQNKNTIRRKGQTRGQHVVRACQRCRPQLRRRRALLVSCCRRRGAVERKSVCW